MVARAGHKKLFQELEQWSQNKDSYCTGDFLTLKGVTRQQLSVMASGKNSCYLNFGKALCQCLDNAYKAWKSEEISKDQFSRYLADYGLFPGDADSWDQCHQEASHRLA